MFYYKENFEEVFCIMVKNAWKCVLLVDVGANRMTFSIFSS